jgi:hypothetical protein
VVSMAAIRLGSWESARAFKGIICDDISEFESHMPSHAVGSVPSMVRPFDSRCGLLRIPLRSRSSEPGADVLRSPLCAFLSRPSGLCPQSRGDLRGH